MEQQNELVPCGEIPSYRCRGGNSWGSVCTTVDPIPRHANRGRSNIRELPSGGWQNRCRDDWSRHVRRTDIWYCPGSHRRLSDSWIPPSCVAELASGCEDPLAWN